MKGIKSIFKSYCQQHIGSKSNAVSSEKKKEIVKSLTESPFKYVVQAWSVLDFSDFSILHAEGFDRYFGYNNDDIMRQGMLGITHPEDIENLSFLLRLCMDGLLNSPKPVKNIGHFCLSYRIKNADGNFVKVLETNSIIESDEEKNIPLICLSQITNIDHLDKSTQVGYYFRVFDDSEENVKNMTHYLSQFDKKVNIFTDTELKIAGLLKTGLTSQQIADKIFRSKHTVDKYRKQMLQKTESSNTAGLITYMSQLNLI